MIDDKFWPQKLVFLDDKQYACETWQRLLRNLDWISEYSDDHVSLPAKELKEIAAINPSYFNDKDRLLCINVKSIEDVRRAYGLLSKLDEALLWLDLEYELRDESEAHASVRKNWLEDMYRKHLAGVNYHKDIQYRPGKAGNLLVFAFRPKCSSPIRHLCIVSGRSQLFDQVSNALKRDEVGDAILSTGFFISDDISAKRAIVAALNRWVELKEASTLKESILEKFWIDTRSWFSGHPAEADTHECPHIYSSKNSKWKENLKYIIQKYVGLHDDCFCDDVSLRNIHEVTKTIVDAKGSQSIIAGSVEPLCVYGAYLIFLMGAYKRLREAGIDHQLDVALSVDWKKSYNARSKGLFSARDDKRTYSLHKEGAKLLCNLGELLAILEGVSEPKCTILSPFCYDNRLTIRMHLGVTGNNLIQKYFDQRSLNKRLATDWTNHVVPSLSKLSSLGLLGGKEAGNIIVDGLGEEGMINIHLIAKDVGTRILSLGGFGDEIHDTGS